MKTSPLVSIIISTFNNVRTIKNCLESTRNQSYKNIELIIVDEWSSDGTEDLIQSYTKKIFKHGKERVNNRNFGVDKAQGRYLLIIDSDMKLSQKVIEECVQLCENNQIDAIMIPEKSEGQGYWAKVRGFERSFYKGDLNVEAVRFFKKSIIDKIGSYDPAIVGAEDWDLHQRILINGYKVGRISNYIIHNEGKLSLKRLLSKKVYYGSAFLEFKKRYPGAFKKSVIRTSLLKNFHHLFLRPQYGLGVIFLKFTEGLSLFYGMIIASRGIKYKHY